jgi:molybdate transport system substrate-binding protein
MRPKTALLFLLGVSALAAVLPPNTGTAAGTAQAADIRVLSGGAAKALVQPLAEAFTGPAGERVALEFQPMGALVNSLAASATSGRPIDMVVVTSEVLERLEQEGRLPKGAGRPIARVGVGLAVNEKAALPDISSAEALRRTLLAARSIVYIDPKTGTSGKHVAEVFNRLGIAGEMQPKTTLLQGGYVVEPVGRGEIELGIHQISEILPVKGIRLVGPLPPELQKYTVYVAVPVPSSTNRAAVDAFIGHLTGPAAHARLAIAGYTAPQ